MSETKKPVTQVLLGSKEHPVRFSYAKVFEPEAMEEGGPLKYSVSVVISKDDKETIAKIEAAIKAAQESGKEKWGGKIPTKLKLPLRDGDEERSDDPVYRNCFFLNAVCSDKSKPQVVGAYKVNGKFVELTTEEDFYSGCYGRVSGNFYAFNTAGNKGIAFGLSNIQKIKDGERLAGKTNAEDDFDEINEVEDDDDLG